MDAEGKVISIVALAFFAVGFFLGLLAGTLGGNEPNEEDKKQYKIIVVDNCHYLYNNERFAHRGTCPNKIHLCRTAPKSKIEIVEGIGIKN